ncbi:hypothetical protein [Serratia proteamaculans]|uniref:Uncharacterized protein n=1 Tax=Serratia proteamaculans TaxID=28151 RepID=A0A5Q2VCY8_SERPR|nr:hypothetical protein [Serratia proteamaculans]QGH63462.1 hypothetical protein GHV41_22585 [Serratia proteamaculans]
MKDYKSDNSAVYLLIITLGLYFLLPPTLVAFFFDWLNLNPFVIIRFWHFNPFSAARGIPLYQTFIYILTLWVIANILLALIFLAARRLYARLVRRTR